ncbi:hypothetical protein [Fusibacter sp. 3D3]|uniref:hypothetical protein n=1 Tax=Fusibacter sp. 3D3 TaxID=1048380 RepID=UPI000852F40E|nr:hypothetical protein [Fusibacter sp. 3D3]GAU76132.1 hypothetical protein F3D3_0729 [Fusibacter sp. 3D3]
MKRLTELIVKALVRGVIYAGGFALVGGLAGLLLKKGFIQGAYMAVLAGSSAAMLVAAYGFIGSPKTRFSFFTHNQYDDVTRSIDEKKSTNSETPENESIEYRGLYPTIIAVELLVIGFIIEALLH